MLAVVLGLVEWGCSAELLPLAVFGILVALEQGKHTDEQVAEKLVTDWPLI